MDSNLNVSRVLEASSLDREIQHHPGVDEIMVSPLRQLSTVTYVWISFLASFE